MKVGNFSKHENKSSYSHRDKTNLLTRRVSQINVYAVKRVFQQSSKPKIAKWPIVHVLSSSCYVIRFELGDEWKATEQKRFCVSNNIVLYKVSVNHGGMDAKNIVSKCWLMRTFLIPEYSQILNPFPHLLQKYGPSQYQKLPDSMLHSPNTVLFFALPC